MCRKEYHKEYYRKNKERIQEQILANYKSKAENKQLAKERNRQWKLRNPDKVKEGNKKYREKRYAQYKEFFYKFNLQWTSRNKRIHTMYRNGKITDAQVREMIENNEADKREFKYEKAKPKLKVFDECEFQNNKDKRLQNITKEWKEPKIRIDDPKFSPYVNII